VDGKIAAIVTVPNTGEMLLVLPAGSHQVNINFRGTWDRIAGALISLTFAIAFLVFVVLMRFSRWKTAQLKPT
jgi:hypothetical protein